MSSICIYIYIDKDGKPVDIDKRGLRTGTSDSQLRDFVYDVTLMDMDVIMIYNSVYFILYRNNI